MLSEDKPPGHVGIQMILLLVVVSFALGWILLPFYGTILWAAIIALLFTPLHRRLLPKTHGRRTPATLLTLLVVLVIVVFPFALITASLAREAALLIERVETGDLNLALEFRVVVNILPDWLAALLDRFGLGDFAALQRRLTQVLTQGSKFIATQALSIGQFTFDFVARLFITLYLAFFLIRDGEDIARTLRRASPLPDELTRELIAKFTTVIRATVKGNLLVAAIQGALGGIAFAFLGVGVPIVWALLMAFLSLLPAVGAALVWLPVAIYLFLTGAVWESAALVAWGVLVIGLIDNLLRPILVGKDTRMPDYVVMITTLGGMGAIGINGFVVGPVIAAMFLAVWHIYMNPGSRQV